MLPRVARFCTAPWCATARYSIRGRRARSVQSARRMPCRHAVYHAGMHTTLRHVSTRCYARFSRLTPGDSSAAPCSRHDADMPRAPVWRRAARHTCRATLIRIYEARRCRRVRVCERAGARACACAKSAARAQQKAACRLGGGDMRVPMSYAEVCRPKGRRAPAQRCRRCLAR